MEVNKGTEQQSTQESTLHDSDGAQDTAVIFFFSLNKLISVNMSLLRRCALPPPA